MPKKTEQNKATPKTTPDVDLLREIIGAFTKHPKALNIELEAPGVIVMQTNRDDHPRVIGANGRNIQALRTIFQFIAARRKEKLSLIVNEPNQGEREPLEPYAANPDWKPDNVVSLLDKILTRILGAPFKVAPISAKATTLLEIANGKDDERIIEILQPALQTIFHAIGRLEGRALYVEVNRNEAAEALA